MRHTFYLIIYILSKCVASHSAFQSRDSVLFYSGAGVLW